MFTMTVWDWLIVGSYVAFCLSVGFILKRRGVRHGMTSYVVSDRSMPWWILGTSMVATTFAAETPLLVANWAYESGISRNWEWWCFLPGAMLTTFLFARLWRRTEVLTDAEYVTLRYSGRAAHALRGFRALYMCLFINTFMIGGQFWVSAKIGTAVLGIAESSPHYNTARIVIPLICAAVAMTSSSLAGISGVLVTDFVMFILKLFAAIVICIYALKQPGVQGLSGLVRQLSASHPDFLQVLPHAWATRGLRIGILTVAIYFTSRWWIQAYGGAEPGGGSYVAQRILSAKSETHALYATLWFNIAHYAIRPWPWVLTGLACVLIFPHADKGETAYIQCIDLVPAGLKGLVLAGFFAALMAIDTRLNLGAAYFVNDFYRPYLVPGREERHYIFVSRIATCGLVGLGLLYALWVNRVKSAFYLTTAIGSGTGLVYALRWYWWRVNAWSEISALAAGIGNLVVFRFVVFPSEQTFNDHGLQVLLASGFIVTSIWLIVTLLTPPSDMERLKHFYRRVRPAGPFWAPVARAVAADGDAVDPDYSISRGIVAWISATAMVLSFLFGTGKFLLGRPIAGGILCAAGVILLIVLNAALKKQRLNNLA